MLTEDSGTSRRPVTEFAKAEFLVDSLLPRRRVLRVLDIKAGHSRFEIRQPSYIVGVDVVQAERGRRTDADEHRIMDLERIELERQEYDVVLCLNVLEHADEPWALIHEIWRSLKDGGTFVIVVPNVVSAKSFVAHLTPWAVHRWFYARVLRSRLVPARAVHSFSLRPTSLLERASANGWKVEYFETYEGPVQRSVRERMGIVGWRWKLAISMTRLLTFGFLSAEETGIITVLTKLPY